MFSFEINEYKVQDISHLTHPNLLLMTAIQMTCALPVLVTPVCIDDKCYIDGGMSCNYPLSYCIESGKNTDEILGFKNKYGENKTCINTESTILDFLLSFLFKAVFSVSTDSSQPSIQNEVVCDAQCLNLEVLRTALSNVEVRKDLFNNGTQTAIDFLCKLKDRVQKLNESSL
jgi:predicted acylesterase/phospholipase RssA